MYKPNNSKMAESAYVAKNAQAALPDGLRTKSRSHDAVQSRVVRRMPPANQEGTVAESTQFVWQLASNSEWFDMHSARIVFDIECADTTNVDVIAPAGGSWASLFRSYELSVKGQSMADAKQDQDIMNAIRNRIEHGAAGRYTFDQVDAGRYDQAELSGVFGSVSRRTTATAPKFSVAIPLAEVVPELGMERSYLPAYALPLRLALRCNSIERAMVSQTTSAALPSAMNILNMRIEVDGLMLEPSIDAAFRELVVDSGVSFYYPHYAGLQVDGATADVNVRTNQVATCLNAAYLWLASDTTAVDTIAPYATSALSAGTKDSMKIAGWNAYVDGRNVYGQAIESMGSLMGELKRAVCNTGDKQRIQAPFISASAFLELNPANIGTGGGSRYRDLPACVFPVCFRRELVKDSVSGMNVALTGGNLSFNLTGAQASAGRKAYLFLESTRAISLSASFLSIIR